MEQVEDLIRSDELSEESILRTLKARYANDIIYTYVGTILISINPYKLLPIYASNTVQRYVGKRIGVGAPHIFALAEAAYRTLEETGKAQSIVISGESGAGKTEATKLVLQYLAAMTDRHTQTEQMILQSSHVLEAFGNAKTIRNNNSSRFGKLIQVHFDAGGRIIGAKITQYLLEKSRIVSQSLDERSYHIFYQFLAGASSSERVKFRLKAPTFYRILNQSGCIEIPGTDDELHFARTRMALNYLGIPEPLLYQMLSILSGILYLGNVTFVADGDGSRIASLDVAKDAAELLGCSAEQLSWALVNRTMAVKGNSTTIPLKPAEADDTRNALMKALYSRMFEWLVARINDSLAGDVGAIAGCIGILDIFGFENFKVNSFEQLCINYTNERLQLHFNDLIFRLEQEEYSREKITWSKVDFRDNSECIHLIDRTSPPGLLALLDEETRFPKATDQTYVEKISQQHKDNKSFERPRATKTQFVVKHYAGDVAYDASTGFLNKNRDTLQTDISAIVGVSKLDIMRKLFPSEAVDSHRKGLVTVGSMYKAQLASLMSLLENSNVFYVRCLKPNSLQRADSFDDDVVLTQLRYAGLLDTVRIRRSGFPVRSAMEDFVSRYISCVHLPGKPRLKAAVNADARTKCEMIAKAVDAGNRLQFGVTKVFLRDAVYALLEDRRRANWEKATVRIQAWWRGMLYRMYYLHARGAAILIQARFRGWITRKRFLNTREAAVDLQAVVRMVCARSRGVILRRMWREAERKREEERRKQDAERKKEEEERRKQEEKKKEESERKRVVEEKKKQEEEKKRHDEERKQLERTRSATGSKLLLGGRLEPTKRVESPRLPESPTASATGGSVLKRAAEPIISGPISYATLRSMREGPSNSSPVGSRKPDSTSTLVLSTSSEGSGMSSLTISSPMTAAQLARRRALSGGEDDKGNPVAVPRIVNLPASATGSLLSSPRDEPAGVLSPRLTLTKRDKWLPFVPVKGIEDPPAFVDSTQISSFSFTDYALQHFRKPTGKSKRKVLLEAMQSQKKRAAKAAVEFVSFSRKPLEQPLLERLALSYSRMAAEISNSILAYIGAKEGGADLSGLLKKGVSSEPLRDEIYAQLLKQSQHPLTREMSLKLWELLALACSSFVPTRNLATVAGAYFLTNTKSDDVAVSAWAKYCLRSLERSVFRESKRGFYRTLPPSEREVALIRLRAPLVLSIYLPTGAVQEVLLDSAASANEAISLLARKIRMQDPSRFGLYECFVHLGGDRSRQERSLFLDEYVADSLARGEQVASSMRQHHIFKKRIYTSVPQAAEDMVEQDLLYAQVAGELAEGILPATESELMTLTALRLQSQFGDFSPALEANFDVARDVPRVLQKKRLADQWKEQVRNEWLLLAATPKPRAKAQFLEIASALQWFGTCFVPVVNPNENDAVLPQSFEVAVNINGMHFVRMENDTRRIFRTAFFSDLTVDYTPQTVRITFQKQSYELVTKQGAELYGLHQDYLFWLEAQSEWATAVHDYTVSDPALLAFSKGETIHVIDKDTDTAGWFMGEILLQDAQPRRGLFPSKAVKMLLRPPPGVVTSKQSSMRSRSKSILEEEQTPAPGGGDPSRRRSGSVYRRSAAISINPNTPAVPAGNAARKSVRQSVLMHPTTGAPKDWRTSRLIDQGKRSSDRGRRESLALGADKVGIDRVSSGGSAGSGSDRKGRWSSIAVDSAAFTWESFARKYFRAVPPASPTGSETSKDATTRSRNKTLRDALATSRSALADNNWSYSKEPLTNSLLVLNAELTKLALETHRAVMKFMNDLPRKESELACLQFLGKILIANQGLRDEIYSQILRQCTENPNLESLTKGAVLLTCMIGLAPPREILQKYLIAYLMNNTRLTGIYADLAALSRTGLDLFARKRDGCPDRTQPTSQQELDAIESVGQLCAVVFFPDNTTRAVDIDSLTTVGEVVGLLGELRVLAGWSLSEIISGKNYYVAAILHDKVLVCDLISRWELYEIPKEVEGAVDWRLTFQKTLFLADNSAPELDSLAVTTMVYQQQLTQLQQGRLLPSEDDAVQMAALQLWLSEGEYNAAQAEDQKRNLTANIDHFVPRSLIKQLKAGKSRPGRYIAKLCGLAGSIRTQTSELAHRIVLAYSNLGALKPHQAMRQWLTIIRQAEFYGSSIFVVQYLLGKEKDKKRVLLVVNDRGYQLYDGQRTPFRVVKLDTVASYGPTITNISIMSGNLASPNVDSFLTDEGGAIADVLAGYMKHLRQTTTMARRTVRPGIF